MTAVRGRPERCRIGWYAQAAISGAEPARPIRLPVSSLGLYLAHTSDGVLSGHGLRCGSRQPLCKPLGFACPALWGGGVRDAGAALLRGCPGFRRARPTDALCRGRNFRRGFSLFSLPLLSRGVRYPRLVLLVCCLSRGDHADIRPWRPGRGSACAAARACPAACARAPGNSRCLWWHSSSASRHS